jgi:hypothetical protein
MNKKTPLTPNTEDDISKINFSSSKYRFGKIKSEFQVRACHVFKLSYCGT